MSNIFSENDVYIMWTSKKPNKGWSNPRDEKGRFTKKQPFGPVTVDLKYLQSLEKRIERLEKSSHDYRGARFMTQQTLREKIIKKISDNDWNYNGEMAMANMPYPEERLADSILQQVIEWIEKQESVYIGEHPVMRAIGMKEGQYIKKENLISQLKEEK